MNQTKILITIAIGVSVIAGIVVYTFVSGIIQDQVGAQERTDKYRENLNKQIQERDDCVARHGGNNASAEDQWNCSSKIDLTP